ncbi:MAG TPA: 4-hydroxy-tetrahydrodipicolinate reductase [Deltaproteobacteria bacterium]|nr:MAG: 4-hydroxy-tetrahydrodipicolinate reductase [Deltaproteobacteria bacterium GWA2_55_82]OGQ62582.1 MAG: 4-hydroxy-tetrahydrodipicolinate reductase [Deltaproteobacteria bacterium RIFCSPLOWO2_02_FULL_55_12]OIJ74171.1 MAG: 4-hydroxy-tetrahydrodipicolinate reductase [Deltaproteobacteria bacterium GWC2_55_46]HBG46792.1 4-hydroxy-tetrahydrodipicolinate reductase [Deltaproteobacteria bacterium]HCY11199.1 4-hydroxy-tetrahydrodipicolinate reductase [Deltaproteobacteria bacterium]
MIKVAVTGAAGRMGRAIINSIDQNPRTELAGALEREDSPFTGKDAGEIIGIGKMGVRIMEDSEKAFKKADVIIDFSTPEATMKILEEAVRSGKAMVIGTTGFSLHQRDEIKELARGARVVMAPNMSIGVNLLLKLVHEAATVVGREYDMEIIEAHHRLKKDAPSGTALKIAEVAANAVGRDLEKVGVYERKGIIGERRPEEIGIQTIRAGDIVGDHTIIFAGPGERVEITHKASSRDTFAAGAVKAAVWVMDKPNGLYDMQDVLGLK